MAGCIVYEQRTVFEEKTNMVVDHWIIFCYSVLPVEHIGIFMHH